MTMPTNASDTALLIIGAGPFGLALAAVAGARGIDYTIVGEPMGFWRSNMPRGMLLRSTCDWHLDVDRTDTIDAWLAETGRACAEVEPLGLDIVFGYTEWFARRRSIVPVRARVVRLDVRDGRFVATLDDGNTISARNVAVAVGLSSFAHIPDDLAAILPAGSFSHTCQTVDLDALRDRRVLIIGGRQSAFEWTALLREAGASAIHVSHRHDTPAFAPSDWTWVPPLLDRIRADGDWYRRLPDEEKEAIARRLWREGRGKLEPWLAPRLAHPTVHLWPRTNVVRCMRAPGGAYHVGLDSGETIHADDIILATGYRVDIDRVPLLRDGGVRASMRVSDGHPHLDADLQTTVPGLFVTGQAATRDFGPLFGFTVAVRASAARIADAIEHRMA
jgi:cation diffusion facilitator CzcD-associated flavoprotein CzcO